jgi:CRISPR-associated protein Csx3
MNSKLININLIDTELNFQILDVKLEGTITPQGLKTLTLPRTKLSKGLIINGRTPIWLSAFLHSEYKNKIWLAQYDPRLGAIITHAKDKKQLLKIIPNNKIVNYLAAPQNEQLIIALLGPPHSGKSVFLYALFKKLLESNFKYFNDQAFIIKGAPDGEGIWSSEISQSIVKNIRYKNKFSNNFVQKVISQINSIKKTKSLIFIDCGGKIDESNSRILSNCNSAIIVSNDQDKANAWKKAYISDKLKLIAEIHSTIDSKIKTKINYKENDRFDMTIFGLDRENKNIIIPQDFINYFIKNFRS